MIQIAWHENFAVLHMHNKDNKLNILSTSFRKEIEEARRKILSSQRKKSIHALALTGGEKAFSAGADLLEIRDAVLKGTKAVRRFLEEGHQFVDLFSRSHLPVITIASGYVYGGGFELFLAGHYRIALSESKFCLPESGMLGIWPGWGGSVRLIELVRRGSLPESMYHKIVEESDVIDAVETSQNGIAHALCPHEEGAVLHIKDLVSCDPGALTTYRDDALQCSRDNRDSEITRFITQLERNRDRFLQSVKELERKKKK